MMMDNYTIKLNTMKIIFPNLFGRYMVRVSCSAIQKISF